MNLFEEPVAPDPFSQVGIEAEVPGAMRPEAAQRTAELAALAARPQPDQEGTTIQALRETAQMYRNSMELMGDRAARNQIASERLEDRAAAYEDLLRENVGGDDDELRQGALLAYTQTINLQAEEEANYALEQQAVRRIQDLAASGRTAEARIYLMNLDRGGALDVIADYQAKQQMLMAALERQEFAVEEQGWMRHLADFAMAVVPLYGASRTGNVDTADVTQRWYDSLFSGQRLRSESEALYDMSPAEMAEFLQGPFLENLRENATLFGYNNRSEQLELMTSLIDRTPSEFETNAWGALDLGGFVPWTKGFKLAGNLTSSLVRGGARSAAVDLNADALRLALTEGAESAARNGVTPENLVNNLQVSAVAPEGVASSVPIAVDVNSSLARGRRGQELLAQHIDLEASARLNADELAAAQRTIQTRLESQFGREVKDVQIESVELAGGRETKSIAFTMGRADGGGFANAGQARKFGNSKALEGEVIQDESGQWFFRTKEAISETGFFSPMIDVLQSGPLRFLLGARNVGDTNLADMAARAGGARSRLLRTLTEPYIDTFARLGGAERRTLAQVSQAGDILGQWFKPDEFEIMYQRLVKRSPSELERKAYQAMEDINDMEFALRQDDAYITRHNRGFKTASFDTGRGVVDRANAIVDRELRDKPPVSRIFNVSTGKHYESGELPPQVWTRLKGQGYQMISLEAPLRMSDGTTIKNFLVKGKDLHIEDLKRDQIAYRAGGHRMYKGKYFVRQTVWGKQGDTGKEFLENPNTYIVAKTRAEAKYWASRMEAARLAYLNDPSDLGVIDDIFGGEAGFPSAKEFVARMDDPEMAYQRNVPFEVHYDRELPSEYSNVGNNLEFVDMEEGGLNGFLRTTGRMYTGRKGDALPDFMGRRATLLDPYETINQSLMNIASLTSFGDYKVTAVERWMKKFGPYIDRTSVPEDWNSIRTFLDAPMKSGNAELNRVKSEALAQREIIMRTLGWKTPNDLAAEQWSRRLSEMVLGDKIDGVVPLARRLASGVDWMADKDPVSALKGFVFDLKMGFGNFAQFPLQLGTAVAATTLSPKLGMQGWSLIMPMRFALGGKSLSKEAFEARVDELIKRGVHTTGGFTDPAEFKQFVRSAARSGFFDLNGSHAVIDHLGAHAAMDGFAAGKNKVVEAGRFFFNEAERWNRMIAWRIAWDEAKGAGHKIGSPEFAAKLAGRADDYAMNMTRESRAYWQKGVLSIPTQFWAYNARMIEAMMPKSWGGSNFTGAQKRRLALFQTLFYGTAGVPLAGAVTSYLKGEDPSLVMEGGALDLSRNPVDSPFAVLDRGIVDQLVYSFTGADVLVGKRFGTGGWVADTVKNIMGMSSYGEVTAADMIGGASFNILGKVGTDVLRPIAEYMRAESGDPSMPVRREALIRLASNISSMGNLYKAYLVHEYGTLRSGSGATQVSDLPSQVAFATALGISPAEMETAQVITQFRAKRSQQIKELSQQFTNYRLDMRNRPDQRETIMEEINLLARMSPPDILREALERVQADTPDSYYAGLVEYYENYQLETETNGETD